MTEENEATQQYKQFLEKLQREEHRPAALNDIKNLLAFKPAGEVISTIRNVGISKIVQCLDGKEKGHIDLTCEVLKVCFDKFEVGAIVQCYTGHIMYLLRHEKSCVRRLAIDEIAKAVKVDPTLLPVPQYIDVFVATGQMVSDEDIGVATRAVEITSSLPMLAYRKVLDEMKIALEGNTSAKCNVFEVITNISCRSYDMFKCCLDNGYIDIMIAQLQDSDVLYQLNILEMLSQIAVKPYGIDYLVTSGALNKIGELIEDLPNNPLVGLITPGYMKFFGTIAHHYPKEVFEKYSFLVDCMFDSFDTSDQSLLPVALDTLGFIGSSIEGKLCLAAIGSKYTQTVQKVGQLVKNGTTELKVRALSCFANLIRVDCDPNAPKTGPIDHRVTLMTREWFRSLSKNPSAMEMLLELVKCPFPDIRIAAISLLDAVCQHQWGEELVARTAGFIEYLLDRTVDYTKEQNEAKFDVIKRLSHSLAFDSDMLSRLQTYVEQGPFFSETTMQVAMDEGDD